MSKNFRFYSIFALLLVAGGYGIFTIVQADKADTREAIIIPQAANQTQAQIETQPKPVATDSAIPPPATVSNQSAKDLGTNITDLLEKGQLQLAVDALNEEYRALSSEQIEAYTNLFLNFARQTKNAGKTNQAIEILELFTVSFNNSLDAWTFLSDIHTANKDWLPAIDALLKATALEYRPEQLERLMNNLTTAASHVRYELESQNNELAINDLYRRLYEYHPDSTRYQLELALSYLRLPDLITGRALLEPLQYDVEYGEIARTTIASLDEQLISKETENTPASAINRNEIVVPLLRSGNSFFVNAVINNRQVRLLLDTGASITALSESTISSLKLKSSGRSIRLSTANGVRQSELFRADRVRLGSLSISNLQVAAIEFDRNSRIDGLLGTDLLNQIDSRYSYVIDNNRNALIFVIK